VENKKSFVFLLKVFNVFDQVNALDTLAILPYAQISKNKTQME